jgi:6-pyruvoyltetrahydropterin/6-carboxytetrahydropterin synthase
MVPVGHKCAGIHGHSWCCKLVVEGPVNEIGWVQDFADIKAAFQPLYDQMDHHYLNDFIDNPTSENVARWVWNNLKSKLPMLSMVGIQETCSCGVEYSGD